MKLRVGDRHWEFLSPGVAESLRTDGHCIVWAAGTLLCKWNPGSVEISGLLLPAEVESLAVALGRWTVVTEAGLFVVDPEELEIVDAQLMEVEPHVQLWVGRDLALATGPSAFRLSDQKPVFLPRTLMQRELRPYATGLGWCWADGDEVGRGESSLGSVPQRQWLEAGPDGALLAGGPQGVAFAPARGPLQWFPGKTFGLPCAFAADGQKALLSEGDHCHLLGGDAWPGRPIGFLKENPVFLQNDTLRTPDTPLLSGFSVCSTHLLGNRLLGPGGALWDLETGTCLHRGLRDLAATDGQRIWTVDSQTFGRLDGPRFLHGLVEDTGDRLVDVRWEDGRLMLISVDGEVGVWDAESGERLRRSRNPRLSRRPSSVEHPEMPVPVLGTRSVGPRTFGWTAGGMLVATEGGIAADG